MIDIPGGERFASVKPIEKGFSGDEKYCVTAHDGAKYFLRIVPIEKHEAWKNLFALQKRLAALGVPMSEPVEIGVCENGVYVLHTWINGEDLENVLRYLPETEQYALGLEAGKLLKIINSIPAPENEENWAVKCDRSITGNLKKYHENEVNRFGGSDHFVNYIEQNRGPLNEILKNRPQCFKHGDYSVPNMMYEGGGLRIIDFDRLSFGDPWSEFFKTIFSARVSPHFATGQLRGYFDGEPPSDFFKLLAFYTSYLCLNAMAWAVPHGQEEIDFVAGLLKNILRWHDDMKNLVPSWYLRDFYIQYIDGVPLKLKSPFDFSFLRKYGKVFKALDDQDSGNLCFGIADGENKYFIKFAGAPAERACVSVEEAIANLKRTIPIYEDLAHPTLIKYIKSEDIGGGFAMVFEWIDAECPHPMYPLSRKKFMRLPIARLVKIFEDILDFHVYVAAKNYVAIDFYDGGILYDFGNDKTAVCDIDLYKKAPYVNRMGRMWGSSKFMSPEEFTLGAVIDEVTNVYAMGATAFSLLANSDRSPESWPLDMGLYDVVKRAVSDERGRRQQSIKQLADEWRKAKSPHIAGI